MKQTGVILLLCILVFAGAGFIHAPKPVGTPMPFVVPLGFPQPVYDFKVNPVTKEGFELGRRLFYDSKLSKDGTISCASCHQQFGAFATYDHPFSHGNNNGFTTRNAPGLFNLAWQKEFMSDGGILHLDLQPLAPLTAANEMGEAIDTVLQKLRADASYKKMFKAAFGSELINTQCMTKALSQFLVMIVSADSKYDKVKRGEDTYTLSQRLGYDIFKQKCISCHQEPLFTDYSYRNVGLPVDSFLNDVGRMRITNQAADSLKFRVPSLRNVAVTFPYMHDGRFYSILDVMNHYRYGVEKSPTTDSLIGHKIPLSNYEIGQITSFLYALTDSTLLKDTRFSDPAMNGKISDPVKDIHTNR